MMVPTGATMISAKLAFRISLGGAVVIILLSLLSAFQPPAEACGPLAKGYNPVIAEELARTEADLQPKADHGEQSYRGSDRLQGKVAIITGADSGIGKAVAIAYAREGADIVFGYLEEDEDARDTEHWITEAGRRCVALRGDVSDPAESRRLVDAAVKEFGKIDVVVSNAAMQRTYTKVEDIPDDEWDMTIATNLSAYFHLVKAALPHLGPGASIIATGSETGIEGSAKLFDYSATKGAIHAFTKTLAQDLVDRGIRVNCVAPGPVWTPLNAADEGATPDKVASFGSKTPMKRPAQPEEIAPAYVFFASDADSSFITGVVLPAMGGQTIGG